MMKFKWYDINSDKLSLYNSIEQLKNIINELFEIAQEQNKYLNINKLDKDFGTSYNKLRVDNKFEIFLFKNKNIIDED